MTDTPLPPRLTVAQFMRYHDVEFINVVYRKILHREPDSEELQHHLKNLRSGDSRKEILYHITNSDEAKSIDEKIDGFHGYRTFLSLSKIPILGNLFIIFYLIFNIKTVVKDLRALHNHVYRISSKKVH